MSIAAKQGVWNAADLKELVGCAGRALESEDRYLVDCATRQNWQPRERPRGIRYYVNERYFQFTVWRALFGSYRWRPELEKYRHDITFFDDNTNELVGVVEIKRWEGDTALPVKGIEEDIKKMEDRPEVPGVMLILGGHYSVKVDPHLGELAKQLRVDRGLFETYSFSVEPWPGIPGEITFLVTGFLATQRSLVATP